MKDKPQEILEEKVLNYYNLALELNSRNRKSELNKLIEKKYSEDLNLLEIIDFERKKYFELGFNFSNFLDKK